VHRRAHANFDLGIEKIFPPISPQSLESPLRLGNHFNTKHKVGTALNLHRHPFHTPRALPLPLAPQRLPDLLHTPPGPPPRNVHPRRRLRDQNINISGDFPTERLERQIVHVLAERVLDLPSDGGEAEDDVRRGDRAGDGYPAQRRVQLEGEREDVDPCDPICFWLAKNSYA